MTDKKDKVKDPMRIWKQVDITDPDHVKKVEYGRKFSAIDAHYQVMTATQTFGPVGEGWGYDTSYDTIHLEDGTALAVCNLTLWWSPFETWEGMPAPGARRSFGPVRGCATLRHKNSKGVWMLDNDAYKKSMTDALTKSLSHLGFSADVFLGKFDDNKYIEERRRDKKAKLDEETEAYTKARAEFIEKVGKAKDPAEIDKILEDADFIKGLQPGLQAEIKSWTMKQKVKLAAETIKSGGKD